MSRWQSERSERRHRVRLSRQRRTPAGVPDGVTTDSVRRIRSGVSCNEVRFPEDFRFQLTQEEFVDLKSQSVT